MTTPKTGAEIRQTFLDFFAARDHKILPSASLVPEDPTVLLTIAGMLPFKPIFLGQQPPEVLRATTAQKCIRTNDIENVGRTARHHTFFEMLGNFSFGDYFKQQAIAWAWELSTQVFNLPAQQLVVSVFEDDDEAFAIWRDQIGVPIARIKRMGADDNFWVSGPTGPCGPCSELYYDFKPELGDDTIDLEDDTRFIEFYNLVFMQYNRDLAGNLTPLKHKNIDTGMGLERMAQILQGKPNNYETDLIFPIIQKAAEIAGVDYAAADASTQIALKIIGDHTRAVVHMIADGITVSNEGRGYVLRRLIRRVIRYGRLIGINREFAPQVAEAAIALAEFAYPQVRKLDLSIKVALQREEVRFLKTLEFGEKELASLIEQVGAGGQIPGEKAFMLYDTYGFPLELTQEIVAEQGLTVDLAGFETEMEEQRRRAQSARETIDLTAQGTLARLATEIEPTDYLGYTQTSVTAEVKALVIGGRQVQSVEAGSSVQIVLDQTPFYGESGGQVGDRGYLSGDNLLVCIDDVQKESGLFVHYGRVERGTLSLNDLVTAQINLAYRRRAQANHTATHLLQSALKQVVDQNISQAGSLVEFDRLRFDFHCPRTITPAELQQIEAVVNTWIAEAHPAHVTVMPIAEAKAKGAIAMFGEKYGSEVRVLDVAGVSIELCGGTHVNNTAEIGLFKIISESGVAAGIRRIEAVAGPAVLEYLNVREGIVRDLGDRFKAKPEEILDRVTALQEELKVSQKQLTTLKGQLALAKADQLLTQAEAIGEFQILVAQMEGVDAESLKTVAEQLQQKLTNGAVVLGSASEPDKVSLVAAFSPNVVQKGLQAGKFVGAIAKICGGGGGGRPNLAQAGGRDASKLSDALATAQADLQRSLS